MSQHITEAHYRLRFIVGRCAKARQALDMDAAATELGLTVAAVKQHLAVLIDARLVRRQGMSGAFYVLRDPQKPLNREGLPTLAPLGAPAPPGPDWHKHSRRFG